MAEPLKYPGSQEPDEVELRRRPAFLTPGYSDRLGDRRGSFEPGSDSCIEILRFAPLLAGSPAFESALRARVEALRHLDHPCLANAQLVERTGSDLFLQTRVPAGRRLTDVIGPHDGWTVALAVVRDILRGLVALNESGDAVHGALSPDRIFVSREGRYVVTEHVLGSALESLHLSRPDLRALGIVVPDGNGPVKFTHATDLMQLGYLMLSLLVARPLPAEDFPHMVPNGLGEFLANAGSPAAAAKVRGWLARAMQMQGATPFGSIKMAQIALDELSEDDSVQGAESEGALLAFASEPEKAPSTKPDPPAPKISQPAKPAAPVVTTPVVKAPKKDDVAVTIQLPRPRRAISATTWIIAAISIVALAEGAAIGGLLYWKPTARLEVAGPPSLDLSVAAALPPVSPAPGRSATPSRAASVVNATPKPTPSSAKPASAVAATVGGLTVTSAIELQVLKDGVAIGSTAAPLVVTDGRYTLDFVNQALGYRISLPVTVTGGQMTTMRVPVPNGHVSINAVPWAEVTIDGANVGQTPLANVPLPIGSHEIVFTHPQLGERRQTVVVKVGDVVRVTQNFR